MNRTAYRLTGERSILSYSKFRFLVLCAVVFLLFILISIFCFSKTVVAQGSSDRVKVITSVEVKNGDTLWSIASNYISDEYTDMNDYIDEIKECNGLTNDKIHTGNFIVIPYFADIVH